MFRVAYILLATTSAMSAFQQDSVTVRVLLNLDGKSEPTSADRVYVEHASRGGLVIEARPPVIPGFYQIANVEPGPYKAVACKVAHLPAGVEEVVSLRGGLEVVRTIQPLLQGANKLYIIYQPPIREGTLMVRPVGPPRDVSFAIRIAECDILRDLSLKGSAAIIPLVYSLPIHSPMRVQSTSGDWSGTILATRRGNLVAHLVPRQAEGLRVIAAPTIGKRLASSYTVSGKALASAAGTTVEVVVINPTGALSAPGRAVVKSDGTFSLRLEDHLPSGGLLMAYLLPSEPGTRAGVDIADVLGGGWNRLSTNIGAIASARVGSDFGFSSVVRPTISALHERTLYRGNANKANDDRMSGDVIVFGYSRFSPNRSPSTNINVIEIGCYAPFSNGFTRFKWKGEDYAFFAAPLVKFGATEVIVETRTTRTFGVGSANLSVDVPGPDATTWVPVLNAGVRFGFQQFSRDQATSSLLLSSVDVTLTNRVNSFEERYGRPSLRPTRLAFDGKWRFPKLRWLQFGMESIIGPNAGSTAARLSATYALDWLPLFKQVSK